MNTPLTLEERQQLIAKAAQDFLRECRAHEHPLSPYADSIVALREKQASYRVIADILRSVGVMVSHHSVARFCRGHLKTKTRRRAVRRKRAPMQQSTQETSPQDSRAQSTKALQQTTPTDVFKGIEQRREESRDSPSRRPRGPRIADPRNL